MIFARTRREICSPPFPHLLLLDPNAEEIQRNMKEMWGNLKKIWRIIWKNIRRKRRRYEGDMKEIWRNLKNIRRNMILNLPKQGASREDMCWKFRPIVGLRGTWKNSELDPWDKYEICESFPLEISSPSLPLFRLNENMKNMREIWRNIKKIWIVMQEPRNVWFLCFLTVQNKQMKMRTSNFLRGA